MEILKEDGLEKQILGILPPTNDEVIAMISGKLSLFSIVNDMTLPQFKDSDIIQGFRKVEHPALTFHKINKVRFTIQHTQAPVEYSISAFKTKNQDRINEEIMEVVGRLFENTMREQAGKTILSKFSKEIDDLMQELNSSTVHFIRCIKPNESKTPNSPNEKYILTQIRYLGVFQTIMIRRNTFPFRKLYRDFRRQFILMFPQYKQEKDEKIATRMILDSLTKDSKAYLMGIERVYISAELEHTLNLEIYKFLALRAEKVKIIQRSLKRCIFRKKILSNLRIMFDRIVLWKRIPFTLGLKLMRTGFD
jgi:myosin heavy subunit